jgi:hypothetical protein
MDSLNRQRKDCVEVEKLEIQRTFCETPCKGIYVLFDT